MFKCKEILYSTTLRSGNCTVRSVLIVRTQTYEEDTTPQHAIQNLFRFATVVYCLLSGHKIGSGAIYTGSPWAQCLSVALIVC
jgi:hypothetical protein